MSARAKLIGVISAALLTALIALSSFAVQVEVDGGLVEGTMA
jgi:hypothetical protein